MTTSTHPVYAKLQSLNITLAAVAAPAAAYLPFVQTGKLVFLSGHLARKDGQVLVGQLGRTMTIEEGKAAARAVAIDLMGTLQVAVGDLDRVRRIVKLMTLVNSTGDFTEHHLVTNGASELLGEVFGAAAHHARSAFGVAQIPMGACVEIELIAEAEVKQSHFASDTWNDRVLNHAGFFSDPVQEWRVIIRDNAGNLLQEVFSTYWRSCDSGWSEFPPGNLTGIFQAYAGQTVTVSFESQEQFFFLNATLTQ